MLMGAMSATLWTGIHSSTASTPPKAYGVVPTQAQLDWQDMEMIAFTHFTLNTFTDLEWGYGDESPTLFNPTDYDPEQIVKVLADAGMKGVILTAKHHDGFCLWPTKTTKHSVASSPWKDGKGDVVRDFAKACKKYGVKFGIYLSPWDRNHASYGTPQYIDVYRKQLTELLTQYGPIFEVWQDGANGGDGFYGGKRDKRSIDRSTYYDWPRTWNMIQKLQPKAVIFSDVGPGVRWVGNESGTAGYPCWATLTPKTADGSNPAPGNCIIAELGSGNINGSFWMPAEADVSIRPGWFWHANENAKVRTPDNLLNLYFQSVGRGANLNLNVPPDRRGKIHENDVKALKAFSTLLRTMYAHNMADSAKVSASSTRPGTQPSHILDRKRTTYWMAANGNKTASLDIKLPSIREFDVIRLGEPIQLGQRIRHFSVHVKEQGKFVPWVEGSSIGARVLLQGKKVQTDEIRVQITESAAEPALSELSLWVKPVVISAPSFMRDANGTITINTVGGSIIRYTMDGSEPTSASPEYKEPLSLPNGGLVTAKAFQGKDMSPLAQETFPVSTAHWKVISAEKSASAPERAFDGNPATLWHTHAEQGEIAPPQTLDIDMGKMIPVSSIVYLPRQDGSSNGIIAKYEVYLSKDGTHWGAPCATGEFANIKANPIQQQIKLEQPVEARFMRFVAKDVVAAHHVSVAELGVGCINQHSGAK